MSNTTSVSGMNYCVHNPPVSIYHDTHFRFPNYKSIFCIVMDGMQKKFKCHLFMCMCVYVYIGMFITHFFRTIILHILFMFHDFTFYVTYNWYKLVNMTSLSMNMIHIFFCLQSVLRYLGAIDLLNGRKTNECGQCSN